jgi:hypothetical protein
MSQAGDSWRRVATESGRVHPPRLGCTVELGAIANGAWRFSSQPSVCHNGRTFCGSVSGQLGDDRSERISGVGADDKVGEAALLPSSQDFLDGRRRVTW